MDNEAADHPGEKDADPGKQKLLGHGPSLAVLGRKHAIPTSKK
jgi:hypothetical protein